LKGDFVEIIDIFIIIADNELWNVETKSSSNEVGLLLYVNDEELLRVVEVGLRDGDGSSLIEDLTDATYYLTAYCIVNVVLSKVA
jgi:hypothetical protein